jgi:hypothetical protein
MALRAAEEALATARRGAEEGVYLQGDVRERELDVMRARRALAEAQAAQQETVSITMEDEKLTAVFTKLFEGTGQSLMLDPAIADNATPVTLTLSDVGLESAVRAICKLYNLEYETDGEGLWVIMPSWGVATVGGTRVPIIGTVTSLGVTPGGGTAGALQGPVPRGRGEARKRPSFVGDERLVDLDVKDVPLSEVASRLSLKADPPPKGPQPSLVAWSTANLEIIADDAVKDLKVTARIAKWPLGEVLDMLLAQTGLVCTVDESDAGIVLHRRAETGAVSRQYGIRRDPVTGERVYPTIRVYLVAAPEMRVSGEGLPSEALVSRYARTGGGGRQWVEAASALQGLRECPNCRGKILMPDWEYCPYCGAEAAPEEVQGEGMD